MSFKKNVRHLRPDGREEFIDDCFTWQIKHENEERSVSEIAKRKKSIIAVIGQREKPGSSMNVIVDQAKLISENIFRSNDDVKRFVNFVESLAEFL